MVKIHFEFTDLPPVRRYLLRADYEYSTWQTHVDALDTIEKKILRDRGLMEKFTPKELEDLKRLKERLENGEQLLLTYTYEETPDGKVHVVLILNPELWNFWEIIKDKLPFFYRKPVEFLMNPEMLLKKMEKTAREMYGKRFRAWIEED